jgi:starvation-inducible DNA-binding protein
MASRTATEQFASTHAHPTIGGSERREVGILLERSLVDLLDLQLMAKQAHWNLVGPRFRALHLHLDEITDELREQSDIIAERSVQVGIFVDGQAGHIAEHTELEPLPSGPIADERAIELLSERLAAVIDRARDAMDKLGELDPASQDIVIAAVQVLEKQLWMLRSQEAVG